MSENSRPVFRNVFVEQDAGLGIAQQQRQGALAVEEGATAQILAIVLKQIEGIEDCCARGLPTTKLVES